MGASEARFWVRVAIPVITRYRDLRLVTPPGVFAPRSDAGLLIDAATPYVRGDVLDVCTGTGVIGLAISFRTRSTIAVDSSRLAVAAARASALLNRRTVRVMHGDLLAPVAGRRFDVILSNPPYLPTETHAGPSSWARAWDGGCDGRAVLDRLCREAPPALRPGGDLLIVQSSIADGDRTSRLLVAAGLEVEVVTTHRGPLGPLARSQAGHLEAIGALARGDASEEMLVIRGHRPT